jgi:hypothetical protein
MTDQLIAAFLRNLAALGQPGLAVTGEENYAALADGGGKKFIIAKSRLPNFFSQGFNPMDIAHLQQLRHRLDTAITQTKKAREAGRVAVLLAEAWDPKMKVEEIKAAIDGVYSPGVPLECDQIWVVESHAQPPRFIDLTPNRPKMIIPIRNKEPNHEHQHH